MRCTFVAITRNDGPARLGFQYMMIVIFLGKIQDSA